MSTGNTRVTLDGNNGIITLSTTDEAWTGVLQEPIHLCPQDGGGIDDCVPTSVSLVRPGTECAREDIECQPDSGKNRGKQGIINPGTCECIFSCGNAIAEAGEECDGGPCCTRLCKHIAQGQSCNGAADIDLCARSVCGAIGLNSCILNITNCDVADPCMLGQCFGPTGECITSPRCLDTDVCTDDVCVVDKKTGAFKECSFRENEACENCVKQRSCNDCNAEGCSWLRCDGDADVGAGNLTVNGKTISLFRNTLVTETFFDISELLANQTIANVSALNASFIDNNFFIDDTNGTVKYEIVNNSSNPNSTIAKLVSTEEVLNACFSKKVEAAVNVSGLLEECDVKNGCDNGGGGAAQKDNQLDSRLEAPLPVRQQQQEVVRVDSFAHSVVRQRSCFIDGRNHL
eukprot:TRINITY_DN992_c0_g2_i3.p1 TRINITY_DN992_c0_g2~~TRINITY_DN992_c0_g2_i3.p1  ORF type:complete len:403 (+),score=48.38 TRINITY_DN992_c0_g2_i3:1141-2349(+)